MIAKLCSKCRKPHKKGEVCPHRRNGDYIGTRYRGTAASRGYDADWRRTRRQKLDQDPLCEDHLEMTGGRAPFIPAIDVHHIKKVKTHPKLRLEMSNLMSLCKACHAKRTARGE